MTMGANGIILTVLCVAALSQHTFAAVDLATGALTITSGTIDCANPSTVTFNLHVCDIGGDGGDITAVKFYYTVGDNYEDAAASPSNEHDASLNANVAAGGEHTFSGDTVTLSDTGSCGTWNHLCAVITVTSDTVTTNDDSCILLTLASPSTDNCPATPTTAPQDPTSGGTPCSTCTDDPPGSTSSTNTTETATESSAYAFSVGRYLMVPSLIAAKVAVL